MSNENDNFTLDLTQPEEEVFCPPGTYDACIERVELKATKNGKGRSLVIKFKLDNGFSIFEYLNVFHESQMAQAMGRKSLRLLLEALQFKNFDLNKDYASLVDRMLKVVTIVENDQQGRKQARIGKYVPCELVTEDAITGF